MSEGGGAHGGEGYRAPKPAGPEAAPKLLRIQWNQTSDLKFQNRVAVFIVTVIRRAARTHFVTFAPIRNLHVLVLVP